MAIKTQDCQILWIIVRWIFVDVMYLYPLPTFTTDAASSIMCDQNFRSHFL